MDLDKRIYVVLVCCSLIPSHYFTPSQAIFLMAYNPRWCLSPCCSPVVHFLEDLLPTPGPTFIIVRVLCLQDTDDNNWAKISQKLFYSKSMDQLSKIKGKKLTLQHTSKWSSSRI